MFCTVRLDEQFLEYQRLEIIKNNVCPDFLSYLTLKAGKFPQSLSFASCSLHTILKDKYIVCLFLHPYTKS